MSLTCCDFYIIPLSFYLVKYFLKFFSNICTFLINALSSINISIRYRFYFVKYFCKYFLGPLGPVYIVPIYNTALYIACQLVFLKSFLFSCLCFFLLYINKNLSLAFYKILKMKMNFVIFSNLIRYYSRKALK